MKSEATSGPVAGFNLHPPIHDICGGDPHWIARPLPWQLASQLKGRQRDRQQREQGQEVK